MSITTIDPVSPLTNGPLALPAVEREERASPGTIGLGSRAHVRLVRGNLNPNLSLPEPRAKREPDPPAVEEPATSAPRGVTTFMPDQSIMFSPVALGDYTAWSQDRDRVNEQPPTRAYRELVELLYDSQTGDSSPRFFEKVNARLTELRRHVGADVLPTEVHDPAGVIALGNAMTNPAVVEAMRSRFGLNTHRVLYAGSPHYFDFVLGRREEQVRGNAELLGLRAPLEWTFVTPVERGFDRYVAGSQPSSGRRDLARQFALTPSGGVVVDDWQLRERSMEFASRWREAVDLGRKGPSNSLYAQYTNLLAEHRSEFASTYTTLLARLGANAEVRARFEQTRAAGDYPEEVYQHVAYAHLRGLTQTLSAYYAMAVTQRPDRPLGRVALESLLAAQVHDPSWRFLMLEATTLAPPLMGRAAVLDGAADNIMALTFANEQVRAIIGLDGYDDSLFDRYRGYLVNDTLFNASYMREYQPALYRELLQPDGTLRRVSEMSRDEQLAVLRRYMMTSPEQLNVSGALRLFSQLATTISEQDFRHLGEVIRDKRLNQPQPEPRPAPQVVVPDRKA